MMVSNRNLLFQGSIFRFHVLGGVWGPYKWSYKWVTGVITPQSGDTTILIIRVWARIFASDSNPKHLKMVGFFATKRSHVIHGTGTSPCICHNKSTKYMEIYQSNGFYGNVNYDKICRSNLHCLSCCHEKNANHILDLPHTQ